MDLFAGTFDGINDAGLCACLLALSNGNAPVDTPRFDAFDELSIVRLLLESCDTVDEATALFERLPKQTVFIPCHYLVADRTGDGAILEWDANGCQILRRVGDAPLVCTNHRVAGQPSGDDARNPADLRDLEERRECLAEALAVSRPDEATAWQAAQAVRRSAFDAGQSVFGGTLWTSLYDLDGGRARFRFLTGIEDGEGMYAAPHEARFAVTDG